MAHPPHGKAVAEYPGTPDTQGQAADGCYHFHAAAPNLAAQVHGAVFGIITIGRRWQRIITIGRRGIITGVRHSAINHELISPNILIKLNNHDSN